MFVIARALGFLAAALALSAVGFAAPRRSISPVPAEAGQLVLVITDDWDAVEGLAYRFQRRGGKLRRFGASFPVVVGEKGLGWGLGLHRADGLAGPRKREGDRRGVAGVFRLARAMGYASSPPRSFKLPYHLARAHSRCVDDAASEQYNQIVEASAYQGPPWSSAERMLRDDELYRWLVVIEHNTATPIQRGMGSCIFFHLWRASDRGTLGCTAAAEEHVLALLAFLDPAKSPVLVQLPRSVYRELRLAWGLPELRQLTDLDRGRDPAAPSLCCLP